MQNKCVISKCNLCDASYYRKNIVNGYGNIRGDIMIIGESPGYYEDKYGKPFVGYGGKYLRDTLKHTGFYLNNIYMTNVTKCKPRGNKVSTKEIKNCTIHLSAELHSMKPKIIILLGRTAHDVLLGKSKLSLSKLSRTVTITRNNTYIFTIYHPSYILSNTQLMDYYTKLFTNIYRIYTKYVNPYYKFQNNLI
jgi:DNA polymerase